MSESVAVLYSGGLDSAILLDVLSRHGRAAGAVVPIYVDCGLAWQVAELAAARRFAALLGRSSIAPPVVLSLPVGDLYGGHWSVDGRGVPDGESPDEAVYLPGRNALLAVKPLVWCGMHGIERLSLATLAANPFPDASAPFCAALSQALAIAMACKVTLDRPFAGLSKAAVMLEGRDAPLEATFSCIDARGDDAPDGSGASLHCGRCNKCAERRRAFRDAGLADPTCYANGG